MAIAYVTSTSFADSSNGDTSNSLAFSVSVGDCIVVVVSRFGFFSIGAVTDDGASGGNTYTQQQYYNSLSPPIAIYTAIATVSASNITCNWGLGVSSTICIVKYSGVGSIGSHGSTNHAGSSTTEQINVSIDQTTNWAVAGLTHQFSGGTPVSVGGNLRVTVGQAVNNYTSIADLTSFIGIDTIANTYSNPVANSEVFCELAPVVAASNIFPDDMTPGSEITFKLV